MEIPGGLPGGGTSGRTEKISPEGTETSSLSATKKTIPGCNQKTLITKAGACCLTQHL
jgi:hypothetical protein